MRAAALALAPAADHGANPDCAPVGPLSPDERLVELRAALVIVGFDLTGVRPVAEIAAMDRGPAQDVALRRLMLVTCCELGEFDTADERRLLLDEATLPPLLRVLLSLGGSR
ncbi:MAG TPA: hypothetical protein VGV85_00015 [Longimicrobiaceae bacterium]|nr:hypothetical protein [Longimicrobiaceae bacterium]